MPKKWLRFRDLKTRGLVNSWPALTIKIRTQDFPPGRMLGPNTRAWSVEEIEAFEEAGRAPARPCAALRRPLRTARLRPPSAKPPPKPASRRQTCHEQRPEILRPCARDLRRTDGRRSGHDRADSRPPRPRRPTRPSRPDQTVWRLREHSGRSLPAQHPRGDRHKLTAGEETQRGQNSLRRGGNPRCELQSCFSQQQKEPRNG